MTRDIIKVKNLKISFFTHLGEVQAVRGINFHIKNGEVLGIVGESGSGKSVTALSILKLLQYPGVIKNGEIVFGGEDLVKKSENEMNKKIRGNKISMIFQDPMTSLNPVFKIGDQITEAILIHNKISRKNARKKALEMLELVSIASPEIRVNNYPHELSGGMRQRVMIAMALSCQPDLLIADEPTTALDVTIQAQIILLLKELQRKTNVSILLITHDLGVVADICDRIIVMYSGLLMEEGSTRDIFYNPLHPYTKGLLKAVPTPEISKENRLLTIPGKPPELLNPPTGCPFAKRCPYVMNICTRQLPPKFRESEHHYTMCWLLHPSCPIKD
ncbi:MAG: ABC transporter ATP-binding protein [Candidatus Atribacteria bacterium]|nr:ABC transporter ATP-binding protein [Candidatus Atribacteria bacterium]